MALRGEPGGPAPYAPYCRVQLYSKPWVQLPRTPRCRFRLTSKYGSQR